MPSGDNTQDVFRIAAFSGFTGDNWRALKQQASQAPVLFGDYLAEMVSIPAAAWAACCLSYPLLSPHTFHHFPTAPPSTPPDTPPGVLTPNTESTQWRASTLQE